MDIGLTSIANDLNIHLQKIVVMYENKALMWMWMGRKRKTITSNSILNVIVLDQQLRLFRIRQWNTLMKRFQLKQKKRLADWLNSNRFVYSITLHVIKLKVVYGQKTILLPGTRKFHKFLGKIDSVSWESQSLEPFSDVTVSI